VVNIDPVSVQLENFLITILSGMLVGLLFDGYRVLRGIINPRVIITDIGDLIFWLVATLLVFGTLLFVNWGEVRLYVFVGLTIGFALYVRMFSKPIIFVLCKTWRACVVCSRFCYTVFEKLIWQPLGWIMRVLCFPCFWIYQKPCRYIMQIGQKAGRKYKRALIERWLAPPTDPPNEPPVNQ
jgi:spore cortex biosynthesis protein YabQ